MTRLRVATLNLLAPDQADWDRRRPSLKAGLAALEPDIIALQETVLTDDYDQAADLLPGYEVVRHPRASVDGVGAALLSRWPVVRSREVDLRVTPRVGIPWSAAVLVDVAAPAPFGPLLVVHHKPTFELGHAAERELQSVACARAVEERSAGDRTHVLLLGDLDDRPDSSSVRFWTGRQSLDGFSVAYQDAWEAVHGDEPGHTFTPVNPLVRTGTMPLETGRRIDYVMVRCGTHGPTLEVCGCRRIFDAPVDGVWASDHFGVVAELRVPERPVSD